eukprot:5307656-Pleurochrysis_carterae.AAC.6
MVRGTAQGAGWREMWTAHGAWRRETAHGARARYCEGRDICCCILMTNKVSLNVLGAAAKANVYDIGEVAALGLHYYF